MKEWNLSLKMLRGISTENMQDMQVFEFESADGPYRLLAAPIEAVSISYRPAEPIQQPQRSYPNLGPLPGFLPKPRKRSKLSWCMLLPLLVVLVLCLLRRLPR